MTSIRRIRRTFLALTVVGCASMPAGYGAQNTPRAQTNAVDDSCALTVTSHPGAHPSVAARVDCTMAKDVVQVGLVVSWPKHEKRANGFCASDSTYVPSCTSKSVTAKVPGVKHASYWASVRIIGYDAAITRIHGATDCTTDLTAVTCTYSGRF